MKIDDTYSMNNTAHWTKKNAQKKEIEELTVAMLMQAKIKRRVLNGRLQLTFHWNNGLDLDNNARVRKAIIDALSGYLTEGRDDNAYIGRIIEEFWEGDGVRVDVEERDDMPYPYLKRKRKEYVQIPRAKKKRAG